MDKIQAANIVSQYLQSFEAETSYIDFHVYESQKTNSEGVIHYSQKTDAVSHSVFSAEYYEGDWICHFIARNVNSLFTIIQNYKETGSTSGFTVIERLLAKSSIFHKLYEAFTANLGKTFDLIMSSRMDTYRILYNETTGDIKHTFIFSVYSDQYPSVYVSFDFDADFNLIDLEIMDTHIKTLLHYTYKMNEKIGAFKLFLTYFTDAYFRTYIECDYKDIKREDLDRYITLTEIYKV